MAKKEREEDDGKHLYILVSVFLAAGALLFLANYGSGVTGYVSVESYVQPLNLTLEESQAFLLSSTGEFTLTSLKLSGEVHGGAVEVVVEGEDGEEWLLYSNVRDRRAGSNSITGLMSGAVVDSEDTRQRHVLKLSPSDNEEFSVPYVSPDEVVDEGVFDQECRDTCITEIRISPFKIYRVKVLLEESAELQLEELVFTSTE